MQPISSLVFLFVFFAYAACVGGCAATQPVTSAGLARAQRPQVDGVLDTLHDAAARADAHRYWSCFSRDAVFLGTDATERWTLDEFKEYATPHFMTGQGWTYTPSNRHVDFSPDGRTAWFDETVTHAQYGACRGTGVLLLTDTGWKIAQYQLTLPIPNDLMPEIAEKIKAFLANPPPPPPAEE